MLTFSVNPKIETMPVQHMHEFKRAFDNEKTTWGREGASEFYFKALDGKVDEYVNLDAYGYACEKYTKIVNNKEETPILNEEEYSEGKLGIYENYISTTDSGIEAVLNREECKDAVEQFIDMHDCLIVAEGVSLLRLVELSHQYNRKAMNRLRVLSIKCHMEEIISTVILNEHCFLEIEKKLA